MFERKTQRPQNVGQMAQGMSRFGLGKLWPEQLRKVLPAQVRIPLDREIQRERETHLRFRAYPRCCDFDNAPAHRPQADPRV